MASPSVNRSLLSHFIETAKKDEAVYISHVRDNFLACAGSDLILDLTKFDGNIRRISLRIPVMEEHTEDENRFIKEYLFAEIYNILSALGGKKLDIYVNPLPPNLQDIFAELPLAFGIGQARKERKAYGRSVNVIERMLDSAGEKTPFAIRIHESEAPQISNKSNVSADMIKHFSSVFEGIENKILCGVDIGGTDIKLAVSLKGKLCYLKEYDWFPALFTRSKQLIDPIKLLLRLLRARVSYAELQTENEIVSNLNRAIDQHLSDSEIAEIVAEAEKDLAQNIIGFDSIGLCFPDVVIRNKIVGGEVFKTRGIRDNPNIEYESEFKKLMNLDDILLEYCAPNGTVQMTNDGPMAAFTAAIELIAQGEGNRLKNGRFAHTLGTELGTGWLDERGEIPEIPLEVYNFIIDLGSYGARQYHPDDLRSINNFNTGLPGTLQKFMAQNGVFRLAIKASQQGNGELYRQLLQEGFIEETNDGVYVALKPNDMRKPLLEFLMKRCEAKDPEMEAVFLEIGRSTGITYRETEHVLKPQTHERIMYGRLVKLPHCFDLIKQGAAEIDSSQEMSVADEQNAFSDLMLQLKAHSFYTVAQFAQSIGALYYGNLGEK